MRREDGEREYATPRFGLKARPMAIVDPVRQPKHAMSDCDAGRRRYGHDINAGAISMRAGTHFAWRDVNLSGLQPYCAVSMLRHPGRQPGLDNRMGRWPEMQNAKCRITHNA